MDAKDLRIESALSERSNDGNTNYAQSTSTIQYSDKNKSYHESGSISSPKVDIRTTRPCAVIGPDIKVPPVGVSDPYIKRNHVDPWHFSRLPEYPHKMNEYDHLSRNISPRQTFQENMQRIMVPNYALDKNLSPSKNNSPLNLPTDAKYCDVPYVVNPLSTDHKSARTTELSVPNINPMLLRNASQGWPSAGVNVRPSPAYSTPEVYQFQEYANCPPQRPLPLNRPHQVNLEEPIQMHSDPYYRGRNVRFEPYPPIKDRNLQPRYEYVSSFPSHYPSPHFQAHKYEMQKLPAAQLPPHAYPGYVPVSQKYFDKIRDPIREGYHRLPNSQSNYNVPFHNQSVHSNFLATSGNGLTNKYCSPEGSVTSNSLKTQFDNNKHFAKYDNTQKHYGLPENLYTNELPKTHMRTQMVMPNYQAMNMHPMPPYPYYRREGVPMRNYDYQIKSAEMTYNSQLSRIPSQFSPNLISPVESNMSNDINRNFAISPEDCGYISQSSTTSVRSTDSNMNMYKAYDHRYGSINQTSPITPRVDANPKNSSKYNKSIDLRQYLEMWNEGDDENNDPNTVKESGGQILTSDKKQYEVLNNQEQLYVLGLVNVPSDELSKYEHIQKVSKLPDNIKGYTSIDLLNQFEEVTQSSNLNSYRHRISEQKEYQVSVKPNVHKLISNSLPSRPLSPLDVEAKISQSVIHKEVGCNFEIKPCSPKMLNVEIPAPLTTFLGERLIEKVSNPLILKSPNILNRVEENECNLKRQDRRPLNIEISSIIPSCNMVDTQCSTTTTHDVLETNKSSYSVHDLESNSGVCLASLPRLDNDIELSFPEVNQQFINANKCDSLDNSPSTNLSEINIDDPNIGKDKTTSETNSFSLLPNETEFSKLSKYRKSKPNKESLESMLQSCVQAARTDSVIIKNPETFEKDISNPEENNDSADKISTNINFNEELEVPINLITHETLTSVSEHTIVSRIEDSIDCEEGVELSTDKFNEKEKNDLEPVINHDEEQKTSTFLNVVNQNENLHANDNKIEEHNTHYTIAQVKFHVPNKPELSVSTHSESDSHEEQFISSSKEISMSETIINEPNQDIEKSMLNPEESTVVTSKEISLSCGVNKSYQDLEKSMLDLDENNRSNIPGSDFAPENVTNVTKGKISNLEELSLSNTNEIMNVKYNSTVKQIENYIQTQEEKLPEQVEEDCISNRNQLSSAEILLQTHDNANCDVVRSPDSTLTSEIEHLSPQLQESEQLLTFYSDMNIGDTVKNINHKFSVDSNLIGNKAQLRESPISTDRKDPQTIDEIHYKNINVFIKTNNLECNNEAQKNHKENKLFNEGISTSLDSKTQQSKDIKSCCKSFEDQSEKLQSIPLTNNNSLYEITGSELSPTENKLLDSKKSSICLQNSEAHNLPVVEEQSITSLTIIQENRESCTFEEFQNTSVNIEKNSDSNILSGSLLKNETAPYSCIEESEIVSGNKILNVAEEIKNPSLNLVTSDKISVPIMEIDPIYSHAKPLLCQDCTDHKQTTHSQHPRFYYSNSIKFSKELFSPFFQKLVTIEEGFFVGLKAHNLQLNPTIKDCHRSGVNCYKSTIDNHKLTFNEPQFDNLSYSLKSHVDQTLFEKNNRSNDAHFAESVSNELDNLSLPNLPKENENKLVSHESCFSDNISNSSNNCQNFIQNLENSEPGTTQNFFEKIKSPPQTLQSTISRQFWNTNNDQQKLCRQHVKKDICIENLKFMSEVANKHGFSGGKHSLKRSLSESALNINCKLRQKTKQHASKPLWPNKRKRKNSEEEIIASRFLMDNDYSLIQNRRNSISTIYHNDSISFCILIDNNCVITQEDQDEAVCFSDIPEENFGDIVNNHIETHIVPNMGAERENFDNTEEPISETLSQVFVDDNNSEDDWVDDVACIETVVSDDIVENNDNLYVNNFNYECSPDYKSEMTDIDIFNVSDYTDKLKNIYGDEMCKNDIHLIQTLSTTPQMNVNQTLHSKESLILQCPNHLNKNNMDLGFADDPNSDNKGAILNYEPYNLEEEKDNKLSNSLVDDLTKNRNKEDLCEGVQECHNNIISQFANWNSHTNTSSEIDEDICISQHITSPKYTRSSSSPEVSSTTHEEKKSGILLKITNYNGSRVSHVKNMEDQNKKIRCKFTEENDYVTCKSNLNIPRPLLTKAAQKYIPPVNDTICGLKVKLVLPQQSLIKLKQLKIAKEEPKIKTQKHNIIKKPELNKKPKPKFEDVLKSIDEVQFKMRKEKTKKVKTFIPKVIIKKNGCHYTSSSNKQTFNPDLTGRKWQPWVFLEKNKFIDKMALKGKTRAVLCHRKNTYILAENFKKYRSIHTNFIISTPKNNQNTSGPLKYTIKLKQN